MYDLKWVPFVVLFNREIQRFLKFLFKPLASPLIASTLYLLIFGVSLGRILTLEFKCLFSISHSWSCDDGVFE